MILIFQKELVILKKDFFKISQLLKDQFELTGKSLEQIDVELAKKIVDKYEEFNCLAASMIKINNEIPHEILTMISIAKDMLILSIESLFPLFYMFLHYLQLLALKMSFDLLT